MPPIKKYSSEIYGGDNQNWMLSQASNNFIYVANNRGLLEFNGSDWRLYMSPNNSVMRAVNVIDDKIYTGCYAELGYWSPNTLGVLEYVSLVPKLDKNMIEDEQVWNIIAYEEWVLFQTNDHIYFYNTKTDTFKSIEVDNIIYKMYKVNNRIYFHVANEGLYRIDGGTPKLIVTDESLQKERVINVFEIDNHLKIITRNSGFYTFEDNALKEWRIATHEFLKNTSVFTTIQLQDGSFMVGTISNGLLHITRDGALDYQITQKRGLSNNTVLSLFEDTDKNVWTGLDNGIDCINVTSAVKTLFDYEGVLGTVYTSQVFKNNLYIGTNQGLFYRPLDQKNAAFTPIAGTEGQVWSLYMHDDNTLFCGHHLGTFAINDGKARHISSILGTWDFKKLPSTDKLVLQGNYSGLYVLEEHGGSWRVRNKIEGFKNSSRYFVVNKNYEVWVNHEYKGVFRLQLDAEMQKVEAVKMEESLAVGKNSSLVDYKNDILYASEQGVFKFDTEIDGFLKDSILSKAFSANNYISGKLITDKTNKLWAFTKENMVYITKDDISNTPKMNVIPISSYLRKGPLGYENINVINDNDTYLLGTANGYITIDVSKVNQPKDYRIYLNAISFEDANHLDKTFLDATVFGEFEYKEGTIGFNYSVPEFDKFRDVNYQYRLLGQSENWSKWSTQSHISFENLSYGNYTLEVRALIGDQQSTNTEIYNFKIQRPWYLSNVAIGIYALFAITFGFITHKAYKRYYSKKMEHEQLENEQTIMQIKNEKLNQDIESKNRELAISTMSIIKKNEVLNSIKKELRKNKPSEESRSAMNLIDKNINNTKDWQFFEQAFNNADKEFLEKIKKAHPELTPNDLRFCAYLRLNLTSKEIAPLLNISTKSVETKRYRLRKRLNLEHDEGLVEYILIF